MINDDDEESLEFVKWTHEQEVINQARILCGMWPKIITPENSYTVYYDGYQTCNHDFSPHHSGLADALKKLDEVSK
jgi:uncharacterized CHY-type Zn-finger protein